MLFEDYYNEYYDTVFRFVFSKINHRQESEDITMDCFVSAYQHFDNFDPQKATFRAWIFAIANNKLKNYYRDKKSSEELHENIAEASFTEELESDIYLAQMREYIYEALMQLNELQRRIVIYKYFYHMNSSQISAETGVPAGSVRVQLSRALKKLSNILEAKDIHWEE